MKILTPRASPGPLRGMVRCVAVGVIFVSLVAGCSTVRRRPISGTDIEPSVVHKIVPNETTKGQVEEWLGPPTKTLKRGGLVEYRYQYSGFVDRKTEAVIYAREDSDKETKQLRLGLRDDVVRSVCYTNTLEPSDNIAVPATACRSLPSTYIVLLPEKDGSIGKVELKSGQRSRLQDDASEATGFDPNRAPVALTKEEIEDVFGDAIEALPEDPARFVLYFENDSTRLTRESRKLLDDVLAEAKRRPAPEVVVVGHTDRRGSAKYNVGLGLRRARIVRDGVLKVGVQPKLVELTSLGEADPIVKTKDGVANAKNRRVEVIVR